MGGCVRGGGGGGGRDKAFCFEPYVNKRERGDTEGERGGTDRQTETEPGTDKERQTDRQSPIY